MRIVMVAPQIGDAFGQERVISRSCELLTAAGHEVFLIAAQEVGNLPPHSEKLVVPGLFSVHTLSSPLRIREMRFQVMRFLQRADAEVVHLHDVPDFRFIHPIGKRYATLLTAHTISPTCPSSARLTSRLTPCTQTSGWACIHHNRTYGCLSFLKSDLHRAHAVHSYLLRNRALRKRMKAVVAISAYVEKTLLADGWDPGLIRRIPNPVDSATPSNIAAPSPLFVFAARITPLKGLETLLRALAVIRHREWTLWVCGEGSEKTSMEALTSELRLAERVQFLGRTTPEQTASIMAVAAAVVAPNNGPETFGLSVAEACGLGVPVVAADMPALNELVVDGQTGLLFPSGDVGQLAQRLETVLDSPAAIHTWALAAQTKIRTQYSAETHLAATVKMYEEAIAKHSYSAN